MLNYLNQIVRRTTRKAVLCAVVLGTALAAGSLPNPATAQGYYDGETITLIMGLDASAGGTTVGRLLAKHLELNLEGNPNVVVRNMPGASMMSAHIFVLLKAPRDGTTLYYGPRSSLGELLEFPGHSFKYSQFTVLGGVQLAPLVTYVRKDMLPEGIQTPADVLRAEGLIFGGISAEHGRMIASTLGLDLIGANYHFVGGYPGSGRIRASVLSGEVNMATDAAHAYLNEVVPMFEQQGLNAPLFSLPLLNADGELVKSPLVPDIPTVDELYESIHGSPPSGANWDAIRTMIEIDQTMQHVFLGPPRMDPQAIEEFRAVLGPTLANGGLQGRGGAHSQLCARPRGRSTRDRDSRCHRRSHARSPGLYRSADRA